MFGGKITLVMGIVIVVLLAAFAGYFKYSQSHIATLEQNNAKLEVSVKLQEQTISVMKQQAEQQAKSISNLQTANRNAEIAQKTLQRKFQTHDINKEAATSPELIQNRINSGTKNAFSEIESLTSGNTTSSTPPTAATKKP